MIAAATARMQIGLVHAYSGAGEARRPMRLPVRIGHSVVYFAGRADQPLGFELGQCFLVLLVIPVNIAALVDDGRRPEKLVQALSKQGVFAAFLFGDRTTWRMRRRRPSRACPAPASVLTSGHGSSCWQPFTAR
jgi:hypothetical protein